MLGNDRKVFAVLVSVGLLVACAPESSRQDLGVDLKGPEPVFAGETKTDPDDRQLTIQQIRRDLALRGCDSVESIYATVVDHRLKTGERGNVWAREEWFVSACAKQFFYDVTLRESDDGGSFSFAFLRR